MPKKNNEAYIIEWQNPHNFMAPLQYWRAGKWITNAWEATHFSRREDAQVFLENDPALSCLYKEATIEEHAFPPVRRDLLKRGR